MPAGRDEAGAIIKTYKVGATAVLPHRFVRNSTAAATGQDGTVIHATDGTNILGVTYISLGYNDPIKYGATLPTIQGDIGEPIDIVLVGSSCIWVIELGAALTEGALVTSDANGRAVATATPAAATANYCFRLLEGGAIGSFRPILMNGYLR